MVLESLSRWVTTLACCAIWLLAGCGWGTQEKTVENVGAIYTVDGTVTVDGKPLSSGTILLSPIHDQTKEPLDDPPADEGIVQDGQFSFNANMGQKIVRITSDDPEVTVSPKYNTESQTEVYVDYAVENTFYFKVSAN